MRRAVLALTVTMGLAIAIPASAIAKSPLAAWWPLYENGGTVAHDTSPNHNNGTLSGGVNWSSGYFGSGLTFDGNTGEVAVPDDSSLEPSTSLTVTAYVKATGSPGKWKYIVDKGGWACQEASYGLYTGTNSGLVFYIGQNGGLSFTPSADAGTGVWDGKWHFVVGTYDGSNVRLYVDGSQVGSGKATSGPISYGLPTTNDLFIGYYDDPCAANNGDNFAGSIDEPTVWDTAWSSSQVLTAYRSLALVHGFISRLPAFPNS